MQFSFPTLVMCQLLYVPEFEPTDIKENHYAQVASLSRSIVGADPNRIVSDHLYDPQSIPDMPALDVLENVEPKLRKLVERLQLPIRAPSDVPWEGENLPIEDHQFFRETAAMLAVYGRISAMLGEEEVAQRSILSAIQMAIRCRRGGVLVQLLAGLSYTERGLRELYFQRKRLDVAVRQKTIAELYELQEEIEPLSEVLHRERIWLLRQDWHVRLQARLSMWSGQPLISTDREMLEQFLAREKTVIHLMITELAILNFRSHHNRLPSELSELIPEFLPAVPDDLLDAHSNELQYLVSGKSYRVYSVGMNGIDNGGDPTESQEFPHGRADLSLEGMFLDR